MKVRTPYSITAIISTVFLALFSVFSLIGIIYFLSLERDAYIKQMDRIEEDINEEARNISANLQNIQQQVQWAAANIGTSNYWLTENVYEKKILGQDIENLLTGILKNSDIADSAFMVQRDSNIFLEKHTMDESLFLEVISTFTGRQSSQPLSPSLFISKSENSPNHLILWEPINNFNTKVMLVSTSARVYVTLPLDRILRDPGEGNTSFLCHLSGNTLSVYMQKGGTGDHEISSFDFEEFGGTSHNTIKIKNETYRSYFNSLEFGGLYLISLIPQTSMFASIWQILLHGVILLGFLLVLTIFGIIMVNTMINTPIHETVADISRIQKGDYTHRLKASSAKEINEISIGINNVLDELQLQNEKVIEAQKNLYEARYLQRESQIMALQAQINPHFLYNTMECIRSIAQERQVEEIIRIISSMIGIYRYSASNRLTGTVGEELRCAEEYAEIMQIRFEDRFTFEFRIGQDALGIEMPKMVLQPLIENAVTHGYANTLDNGLISVTGECRGEELLISVYDEGEGIAPEKLDELRNSLVNAHHTEKAANRIGLYNVDQRLKKAFGENHGLEIESAKGAFTKITIRIPIPGKGE